MFKTKPMLMIAAVSAAIAAPRAVNSEEPFPTKGRGRRISLAAGMDSRVKLVTDDKESTDSIILAALPPEAWSIVGPS